MICEPKPKSPIDNFKWLMFLISDLTDLESEDEEGVPEERHREALPGLHSFEALAADVAEDVFGVVGEGEEHGQETRQQHAVDEDRHRTEVLRRDSWSGRVHKKNIFLYQINYSVTSQVGNLIMLTLNW